MLLTLISAISFQSVFLINVASHLLCFLPVPVISYISFGRVFLSSPSRTFGCFRCLPSCWIHCQDTETDCISNPARATGAAFCYLMPFSELNSCTFFISGEPARSTSLRNEWACIIGRKDPVWEWHWAVDGRSDVEGWRNNGGRCVREGNLERVEIARFPPSL